MKKLLDLFRSRFQSNISSLLSEPVWENQECDEQEELKSDLGPYECSLDAMLSSVYLNLD